MISPPTHEESGEPVREMDGAESEGGDPLPSEQTVAGPPATDPEVKEEKQEVSDRSDPVSVPGGSAAPEGATERRSPPGQYRAPPAPGRLIPAGMEDMYISTPRS